MDRCARHWMGSDTERSMRESVAESVFVHGVTKRECDVLDQMALRRVRSDTDSTPDFLLDAAASLMQ